MAMTRLYDLAYEVDGEQIHLEQSASGEVIYLTLHRSQLAHLAVVMGLLADYPTQQREDDGE